MRSGNRVATLSDQWFRTSSPAMMFCRLGPSAAGQKSPGRRSHRRTDGYPYKLYVVPVCHTRTFWSHSKHQEFSSLPPRHIYQASATISTIGGISPRHHLKNVGEEQETIAYQPPQTITLNRTIVVNTYALPNLSMNFTTSTSLAF